MGVCGGEVICLKRVQQSLLNQSLDPPYQKFLNPPLIPIYRVSPSSNVRIMFKPPLNFLIVWAFMFNSILEPSQVLEFLGFFLNSMTMTVTLSHTKVENITQVCKDLLTRTQPTIREVAVVIGKLVASCPGVAMVPLFYRQLKKEKTVPLKFHHGNFDESIALSPVAESDLQW